jgi:hypothetical protein
MKSTLELIKRLAIAAAMVAGLMMICGFAESITTM